MPRADLTSRYIQLVEELAERHGSARGWQGQVAKQLGIDQPTLSKIIRGDRRVGWELAQRAVQRLKLDPGYFSGARASRAGRPADEHRLPAEVEELVAKIRAGIATTRDVYALARAVVDDPAVKQARAILRSKRPRSEQQIGALFLAASKLIDLLEKTDRGRRNGV